MNNRNVRAANRGGFSLLELMLVLAIIGVLTAIAAFNLAGAGTRAKIKASQTSMTTIRNALRNYQLDNNIYPTSLQALTTGKTAYLSNDFALADGWQQPFIYAVPGSNGREFDLYSKGPDGVFGTADDLDVWKIGNGQ
jgi:general secretion pathway protein G